MKISQCEQGFLCTVPVGRAQPMSRKQRRKARRYQAWSWRASKKAIRNPMTGFLTYLDQDTRLMVEERIFADGSHHIQFSGCGIGAGGGALARLVS